MTWEEISPANQMLFFGVAEGWWEDVDTKRWQPIPFPIVINTWGKTYPTMAHILAEAGIFDSVSTARKAGWNKPVELGEHWFHKRTKRLLIIWVDESQIDD